MLNTRHLSMHVQGMPLITAYLRSSENCRIAQDHCSVHCYEVTEHGAARHVQDTKHANPGRDAKARVTHS